jgi:hypothetical protein
MPEVEMSSDNIPTSPNRSPSDAEKAMSANARSRDRQGKAEDHARRQRHVEMIGDRTEAQNRGQPGDPSARIGRDEVEQASRSAVGPEARSIRSARQDAAAGDPATGEGIGEPR